ncbi:hypothetical protein L836_5503 [Mycobacteroides abscessus MAB_110811_2726]|nr:hypothetical protein L836_5503 [Mycobacteroides abscessus MAB_110811_2726]
MIADELPAAVTLNSLIPLKLRWGISLGALIMHLRQSALIDQDRPKPCSASSTPASTPRQAARGKNRTWLGCKETERPGCC